MNLQDCLKGLEKAVSRGWFNLKTFDSETYWDLDKPISGDLHRICPKFVAMKGPLVCDSKHREPQEIALTPQEYIPILNLLDVLCVVRLNDLDTYDKEEFERAGIAHYDLYFDDCTAPPDDIVQRFLDICDREGRVAVHCRAGLGRTGTLIGAWLMKHAGFGADEAMGWLRIVRPGSVIGPQQHYLKGVERRGWQGNAPLPALDSSHRASSAHSRALAAQVMAGMCARGAAKAAAAQRGKPLAAAASAATAPLVRPQAQPAFSDLSCSRGGSSSEEELVPHALGLAPPAGHARPDDRGPRRPQVAAVP